MFLCLGITFTTSVNKINGKKLVIICVNGDLETFSEKK